MGRSEAGVRHPHILDTDSFVNGFIGFLISAAVGLTGIGGRSFTVPALAILASLPAGPAVGTAFVFAGVLRLIAAPFYVLGRHVHVRYLWLLLRGAVPGLWINRGGQAFCRFGSASISRSSRAISSALVSSATPTH